MLEWQITVPNGLEASLELEFTLFDVEEVSGCYYDYLELFDGCTVNLLAFLADGCAMYPSSTHREQCEEVGAIMWSSKQWRVSGCRWKIVHLEFNVQRWGKYVHQIRIRFRRMAEHLQ